MLDTLAGRIQNAGGEFPHEIGLFLGYPLGDVKGFIKHKAKTASVWAAGRSIAMSARPKDSSADLKSAEASIVGCTGKGGD